MIGDSVADRLQTALSVRCEGYLPPYPQLPPEVTAVICVPVKKVVPHTFGTTTFFTAPYNPLATSPPAEYIFIRCGGAWLRFAVGWFGVGCGMGCDLG